MDTPPRPRTLYLDYNATAPLLPGARCTLEEVLDELGNPSSVHRFGRRARARLEDARAQVAALAAAKPAQVIFTSGGTEANNLALRAFTHGEIWVSAGEHDSVLAAVPEAERLALDPNGVVCLRALEERLGGATPPPALLSVMAANNETGVLQPLEEILRLARAKGVRLHVDAAQYLGRMPVGGALAEADLVTIASHKFGGPQGAGALVVRDAPETRALLLGGGQERGLRAGTENTAAIAAFGAAAAEAASGGGSGFERLAVMRDALEDGLAAAAAEAGLEVSVAGGNAPRLANTSCFALEAPGVDAELLLAALDLEGVAVSSGSACSSGKVTPSHVLRAMGWSEARARASLRVSFGWASTAAAPAHFLEVWKRVGLLPYAPRAQASSAQAQAV